MGGESMGPPTTPRGFDVGEQQGCGSGVNNSSYPPPVASSKRLPDFILRFLTVVTTLIAAIVMATTKQTVQYVTFKTTGKDSSQLEFFIAANSIAFVYSVGSLALMTAKQGTLSQTMKVMIAMMDLIMLGFLFSAVGTAAGVSVGLNSNKICDVFDKYCNGIAAAVAMSTFGATALLALVMLVLLGTVNR